MPNRLPILYSIIALLSAGIISGGIYFGMAAGFQNGLNSEKERTSSSTVTIEGSNSEAAETKESDIEATADVAPVPVERSSNTAAVQKSSTVDTTLEIEKCRVSSEKLEGVTIEEITSAANEATKNYAANNGSPVSQDKATEILDSVFSLYKHNLYDECINRIRS